MLGVVLLVGTGGCAGPSTPASGGLSPDVAPTMTIEYSPGLTEDLYLPTPVTKRVPLVVLVPGGAWMTADPTGLAGLAAALADGGVAAAPTHVRAAEDGVTYPTPVEDVLCAVAVADQQVREAGIVPGPVVVLGHSSGAHLAALAALATADYPSTCRSRAVAPDALVGLSGPYDISRVPDVAINLMGDSPDDDPAAWASANPVERADLRPDVPVLLLHGDADPMVPVELTTEFAHALERGGHPTTVEIVPEADHDTIYAADVAAERILAWLGPSAATSSP